MIDKFVGLTAPRGACHWHHSTVLQRSVAPAINNTISDAIAINNAISDATSIDNAIYLEHRVNIC